MILYEWLIIETLQLWKLLMPEEELENRFSTQWQKIGFQGKDPSTDFRAMGLLALDNLYYFAEKYNENVQRILKASNKQVCLTYTALILKIKIGFLVLFCYSRY